MKLARFVRGAEPAYGLVEDHRIVELTGSIFGQYKPAGKTYSLSDVKLLAPCAPSKVLCIGRNYVAHAAERGVDVPTSPILFLKAPSAIVGQADSIVLPDHCDAIDHEAELVAVFKDTFKNVSEDEALQHVLGYTCGNDVSHRPFQKSDGQWARAKSFDTFCPLGPWIETDLDPNNVQVKCQVNGQVRQDSSTSLLIFGVPFLISWLSRCMTIQAGDVLMTGTPSGIGPLRPGDVVEVSVEGIGTLSNPVT